MDTRNEKLLSGVIDDVSRNFGSALILKIPSDLEDIMHAGASYLDVTDGYSMLFSPC